MIEFLEMNIEAETTLLEKLKQKYGSFSFQYKTKLEQVKELRRSFASHKSGDRRLLGVIVAILIISN